MKYEFEIHQLGCAHCSQKIEDALSQHEVFEQAKINFLLRKVEVETKEKNKQKIAKLIEKIANQYEEGIQVSLIGEDEETRVTNKRLKSYQATIIGTVFMIAGFFLKLDILFVIAYMLVGYDVIIKAFKNILKGRMLDENFLMTIATVAAFIIGEYPEAVAVMLFYKAGEYMQNRAVDYSKREIEKAMDIRPDFARVIRDLEVIMSPQSVKLGEIIEVRPGEKVPLDGVVIEGHATLDTSMLTGESLPISVKSKDEVLSGSINQDGVIRIKATQLFSNSTVSKILELIQSASSKKAKSEEFITRFAKWYTPLVVGIALLTAIIGSLITGDFEKFIYISIVFLVISCPCALVVSIPLGFFGGLGAASKASILVKGSNYLEALNHIDTLILDKTGTITKGEFGVVTIKPQQVSKEELLAYVAAIESRSNHPIAKSIVKAHGKEINRDFKITEYQEISGRGIKAKIEGEAFLVGNDRLMKEHQIIFADTDQIGIAIHVAKGDMYLGYIVMADQIKKDSKKAILSLKQIGIKKVIMLTGDKKHIAEEVAKEVGVDEVYAELLPQDKVFKLEEVLQTSRVAFVGDGINDAPVLRRADIGIAMGGVGSDAAIEAADIVLMTDRLGSIVSLFDIAKKTRSIVTQNIVFALSVKVIVLALGLFGVANMWLAVFADVGVSLLAIINSVRVLGRDKKHMIKMIRGTSYTQVS